jgi:hypothetical protein
MTAPIAAMPVDGGCGAVDAGAGDAATGDAGADDAGDAQATN